MSDTIGNQFATLRRVKLSLFIEEFVHIHTLQLGDALLLRHLGIEFIHLLLDVYCSIAACH